MYMLQYAALGDVPTFKIKADEGAEKEDHQFLLLGASTINHMTKPVCNREEQETAVYYMSKPGCTVEEMYKALRKAMETKEFFLIDNHCHEDIKNRLGNGQYRPLMIVVYMSLNDLGAILDAEYLTDMLEAFRQLVVAFEEATNRKTRISFTLYMFAPSRRDFHSKLSEMNLILERANRDVFGTATYDPNTRLLRPVKPGRPGNTTLIKPNGEEENFHSDNTITGNWALPGAYHVADKKLREIMKDLRVFFNWKMQESNPRPWDAYDMDVEFQLDEAIPKFNPNDEFPSLNSALLYANRTAGSGTNRHEQNGQQQQEQEDNANGRTLGGFIEQARERGDRRRDGKQKQSTKNEEKKARLERSQEERKKSAREAARKKTKERLTMTNQDEANRWQQIRESAESVRPAIDNRTEMEGAVANLNVGEAE